MKRKGKGYFRILKISDYSLIPLLSRRKDANLGAGGDETSLSARSIKLNSQPTLSRLSYIKKRCNHLLIFAKFSLKFAVFLEKWIYLRFGKMDYNKISIRKCIKTAFIAMKYLRNQIVNKVKRMLYTNCNKVLVTVEH